MSGGRPTKEAANAGFESEVIRLLKVGKKIGTKEEAGTICAIMNADRSTVYRIKKRWEGRATAAEAREFKRERAYAKQSDDDFSKEPAIAELMEDLKTRRVKSAPSIKGHLRRMCEELQVYPDQLVPYQNPDTGQRDFTWGKKWLALKSDVPLAKLREPKKAFRALAKKHGATDYELAIAGFDAKKYGTGKWRHVQLTEDQIAEGIRYLGDATEFPGPGREEALFVFRFGIETCRPKEPIWGLTADQFYVIPLESGKNLFAVNIFRKKTEKSGAPYRTAYVAEATYNLAKRLGAKNGPRIMDGFAPEKVYPLLRQTYVHIAAHAADPDNPEKDYFQEKPTHALRHSGAQRLLRKTQFNRAVVAELGGWEDEGTLADHYGGVPEDVIRGVAGELL